MNKYYTSDEYTVSPHSIKFDPEMVEFNRIQTDEEYQATIKPKVPKRYRNIYMYIDTIPVF